MSGLFGNLMQGFKGIEEQLEKSKQELAAIVVTGESGAGMVKVEINGKMEVLKVDVEDSLLTEDKSIMLDLLRAAFNSATGKMEKLRQEKLTSMLPAGLSGLKI